MFIQNVYGMFTDKQFTIQFGENIYKLTINTHYNNTDEFNTKFLSLNINNPLTQIIQSGSNAKMVASI